MCRILKSSLLAVMCICLVQEAGESQEPGKSEDWAYATWPQFRGVNCSGIAHESTNVPAVFGPQTNVRWRTPLPPGASSPCLWGGRIFLTTFESTENRLEVLCLNRVDGQILWRRDVPVKKIEPVHSATTPANGTTATDGERVYAYFGSCGLLCYDFQGELIWSLDLPIPKTRNGSGTSPVVSGDVVLLNRDETDDSYLLAVDKRSGEIRWKHTHLFRSSDFPEEGHGTPIVWKHEVILHTHEGIRAISLDDGELVWQVNTVTTACSTPVVSGKTLFVATWQNLGEPVLRRELPTFEQLSEHDADGNGTIARKEFPRKYLIFDRPEAADEKGVRASAKMLFGMADTDENGELTGQEWKQLAVSFSTFVTDHGLLAVKLGGRGDVTQTHVKILATKNLSEVPSPLVYQGRVYMVKNGGIVSCFDTASGKPLKRKRIGASGSYYASPIAVGDCIYLASSRGVITVLRAGDKLEVVAQNQIGERILATPAAVEDTIYVRTNEHLYAFSESSP